MNYMDGMDKSSCREALNAFFLGKLFLNQPLRHAVTLLKRRGLWVLPMSISSIAALGACDGRQAKQAKLATISLSRLPG
jgi:hypothetical protein